MQKWIVIKDMRFFSQDNSKTYDVLKAGTVIEQVAENSISKMDRINLRNAQLRSNGKRVIICKWKGLPRYCKIGSDVRLASRNTQTPRPVRRNK